MSDETKLDLDHFKYKIPNDVLAMIPAHFWAAFVGELVSIFSLVLFDADEDGNYGLYYITGTSGWGAAFKETCTKLDMKWLSNYYDQLTWWESDQFDGEIVDILEREFIKRDHNSDATFAYYTWLINKE